MNPIILKGTIVSAPVLGRLEITPGGYLAAEEGRITRSALSSTTRRCAWGCAAGHDGLRPPL